MEATGDVYQQSSNKERMINKKKNPAKKRKRSGIEGAVKIVYKKAIMAKSYRHGMRTKSETYIVLKKKPKTGREGTEGGKIKEKGKSMNKREKRKSAE